MFSTGLKSAQFAAQLGYVCVVCCFAHFDCGLFCCSALGERLADSLPAFSLDLVREIASFLLCAPASADNTPIRIKSFPSGTEEDIRSIAVDPITCNVWLLTGGGHLSIHSDDGLLLKSLITKGTAIAFNANGSAFLAQRHKIMQFSSAGDVVDEFQSVLFGRCAALAVDRDLTFFLSMPYDGVFSIVSRDCKLIRTVPMNDCAGVAVSDDLPGEVFVVDDIEDEANSAQICVCHVAPLPCLIR